MADICPAATWTSIPELDRQKTPAILLAPGCLPGTADRNGACATRDLRYTIAIPWSTFLTNARKAPGGNLYWYGSVPADRRNPTAFWFMNQMAMLNYWRFQVRDRRANERVRDLLAQGFLTKIGLVSVPVDPRPDETTVDLLRRGGQLFFPPGDKHHSFIFDGNVSHSTPIYSFVPRQNVPVLSRYPAAIRDVVGQMFAPVPDWMTHVRDIEVYANYVVNENVINYTIRLAWSNAASQVIDDTVNWIANNASKLCTTLNNPNVVVATTAAGATPVTAPYAAGATTARQLCNLADRGSSGCIPRPAGSPGSVEALLATPVILSGRYMRFAAMGRPAAAKPPAMPTMTIAPTAPTPTTSPTAPAAGYPAGTIAWRDPQTPGYDIAIPAPVGGITHQVVAMGVTTLPAGLHVVDRREWERATLPWFRRRTAKIGMAVAGVALAAGATFAVAHTAA